MIMQKVFALSPRHSLVFILVSLCACGNPEKSAKPSRQFLQTRSEMLQKYGTSVRTSFTGSFAPCERLSFRSDTLSIDADFSGEQCHYIRYTLPNWWTDEQIAAALASNGSHWQLVGATGMGFFSLMLRMSEYVSQDGHHAKYSAPAKWLEIWSSALVARSQQIEAERQRKADAIPKF